MISSGPPKEAPRVEGEGRCGGKKGRPLLGHVALLLVVALAVAGNQRCGILPNSIARAQAKVLLTITTQGDQHVKRGVAYG